MSFKVGKTLTLFLPCEDWSAKGEDTSSSLSSDEDNFDPDYPFTRSGSIDTTRKTKEKIPMLNLELLLQSQEHEIKSSPDTAKTSIGPSSDDEVSARKQKPSTPRYHRFSVSGGFFTKKEKDLISNETMTTYHKNKPPLPEGAQNLQKFSFSDTKITLLNLKASSKSIDILRIKKTLTIYTSPPKTIQLPLFRKELLTGKTFFKLFEENKGLKIAVVIYKQPKSKAIFHLKEFKKLKKSNKQLKNIQTIQYFSLKSLEQPSFKHLKKWKEKLKPCFN